MKFLFLSPVVWNFYPLQNQNLAISLAEREFEVFYIEPVRYKKWQYHIRFAKLTDNKKPAGLTVVEQKINIPKSFFVFIYENFKNVKQIKKYKPEVVVCYDHLMGFMPCIYCYFKKIKFVFNVSDDWDNMPQSRASQWMWKHIIKPAVAKFSYAIASISHKQLALFKKKNKNTFILPNGLICNFIDNINSFEENNNSKTVNFIANLRDWYDFDLLFDVFSELPELQLNIYGLGPLYESLKEKSEKYSNIHLLGNISQEGAAKLLKDTLFGILPLKPNILNDSTSPVKLFDYWAAQKAVVATPTLELKSIGEDCILFAQNKQEWLKHIRFLIDNAGRREFLGKTGSEKIVNKYNYEDITGSFLKKIKTS